MRVLVLLCVLLAPLAAAQSADAPHPSPTANILYAHHTDGADEAVGWMNTDIADPDSNDIAMGAAANYVTARTWALHLDPATAGEVVLDGDIKVMAHMGGGSARGVMDVSTQVLVDGTAVASGAAKRVVLEASAAAYPLLEWTLPVSLTLQPGQALTWTLKADGAATAIFLGVHEERGKSHIILPITSADVPVPVVPVTTVYENLTGDVDLRLAFNATTSQTVYNWTAPEGPLDQVLSGNLTGNVTITISDGTELFNQTFSGLVNATQMLSGPGNWTITVDASDASGELWLRLAPHVAAPDGDIGGPGQEDADVHGEDGPDAAPSADKKESPGFGLVVIPALLAIALLRRR